MRDNPLLEAALRYAGRGWPVFAVSYSKVPFKGSHGFLDGTTDPAKLEAMWKAHPRANVALATGNTVVFDCDGPAGLDRFLALGKGARTLVSRTPRGGWHFFYAAREGVQIRSKAEVRPAGQHDGLDIRGHGGFVLLPPSKTKDGVYQWAHDHPIAPIHDSLISFAESINARQTAQTLKLEVPPHLVAMRLPDSGRFSQAVLAGFDLDLTDHERARIESALNSIGATIGYDNFLKIGFSLHSLNWVRSDGTDAGFELWDQWASGFPDTYNQAGLEKKWQSFGRGEYPHRTIGIGTLFNLAADCGWRGDVATTPTATLGTAGLQAPGTMPASLPGTGGNAGPGAVNGTPANLALPAAFVAQPIVFPDTDGRGRPKATCMNARKAIEALEIACQYDVFHEKMLVGGHAIEAWSGDLSDHAVQMLRDAIYATYRFDPGERHARDAAVQECLKKPFNPVTKYLDGLQWDHTPRIARWVMQYLGAPDNELPREFGRIMLIAAVRRARHPGTKFDQIIVLEGPQGIGKSTAVQILAGPENFSDQHILGLRERDQQEAVSGVWLHEPAELRGIRRAESEHMKQFARRTEDRARPAYGRFRIDKKRQCIFVATTNETDYLKEYDRAFWPIPCGTIDLKSIARDRDQLWAEAATLEASGASLLLPSRLYQQAAEHVAERQEVDAWEDVVADAIWSQSDTSVNEILIGKHFLLRANEISQANQNRVARILKKLGWERYKHRDGEKRSWRYRKVGPVGTLGH